MRQTSSRQLELIFNTAGIVLVVCVAANCDVSYEVTRFCANSALTPREYKKAGIAPAFHLPSGPLRRPVVSGTEVQVLHIAAARLRLQHFGTHFLAAALGRIRTVLAVALLLDRIARGIGAGQVLAHFGAAGGSPEAGVRRSEFSLAGEGRTGGGNDGGGDNKA